MRTQVFNLALLISLLAFSACSSVVYLPETKKTDKKELKQFLKELPDVAVNKHYTELMEYMDAGYLKDQHEGFLKGDDIQFVNEIFCGNDINDNSFHCINQNEITSFEIKTVEQIEDTKYKALFIVGDAVNKVSCEMLISKTMVDGKPVFGLIGAVG